MVDFPLPAEFRHPIETNIILWPKYVYNIVYNLDPLPGKPRETQVSPMIDVLKLGKMLGGPLWHTMCHQHLRAGQYMRCEFSVESWKTALPRILQSSVASTCKWENSGI